jgi:ADP-ribosylglycohydrolase
VASPPDGRPRGFIAPLRAEPRTPYGSWGNGSAMRVSPVAWAFDTLDEVLEEARRTAVVTHDHEDAVRNAISLGGDAGTMACIAGAIAEAHYGGVPAWIERQTLAALDPPLRERVERFRMRFGLSAASPAA